MVRTCDAIAALLATASDDLPVARRRSGSGGRPTLSNAQESIRVAELQIREDVKVCIIEQLLQDSRALHARVRLQYERSASRHVRASHRGTAVCGSASVTSDPCRQHVAARRPDVRAGSIVTE